MGKLFYITPVSLDGFLSSYDYDWSPPGEVEMQFMTDALRPIDTHLYGRKNYETMKVWNTPEVMGELTPATKDFANIWQAANKIIYSKTLDTISTKNTKLESNFEPATIKKLKDESSQNFCIAGPNLAAQAMRAGLIDEFQFFVVPKSIGGDLPVLPRDFPLTLDLIEAKPFGKGWLSLRYRPRK
ncbi:MAG: deaminase [Proteobacteria bacterium]|nr:MAG: deaminase [Pseudomonadota bacterium]